MLPWFVLLPQRSHVLFRAPVLSHGSDSPRTGTAPVTHQDQGKGALRLPKYLRAPGQSLAPENRRCQAMSKSEIHNSCGFLVGPTPCWLMAWAVPMPPLSGGGLVWIGQRLIKSGGSQPTPFVAHCPSHCENQAKALFTSNGT
jgi:hypothetical protein